MLCTEDSEVDGFSSFHSYRFQVGKKNNADDNSEEKSEFLHSNDTSGYNGQIAALYNHCTNHSKPSNSLTYCNTTNLHSNGTDRMSIDQQSNEDSSMSNEFEFSSTTQNQRPSEPSKYELERQLRQQAEQQHERKRKLFFTQPNEHHNQSSPSNLSSRTVPLQYPQTHRRRSPKYGSYKSHDIRIKSFLGFHSACNRSPETFAAGGFFFKGFSDIVACFQCGFTYKNWQMNDDPIFIHKTFQSDCDFITQLHLDGVDSSADLAGNSEKDVDMKEVTSEAEKLSISK